MNIFKGVKVVVQRYRKAMRGWNSTDVYLVTGLVTGFCVWLVMGFVLMQQTLKAVGL